MSKHPTDPLIKKQVEQWERNAHPDHFDPQRSWPRLEMRLKATPSRKSGWWKYAAAVLVLIAVIYGGYHFPHSPNKTVKNRPHRQQTLTKNQKPVMPAQNRKEEDGDISKKEGDGGTSEKKAVPETHRRKSRQPALVQTQNPLPTPDKNRVPAATASPIQYASDDSLNIPDPAPAAVSPIKKPTTTEPSVVYYHEIISSETGHKSRPAVSVPLSITIKSPKYASDNRERQTSPLKIKFQN